MRNIFIIIFIILILLIVLRIYKKPNENLEVNILNNDFYNLGLSANTDKIYTHGYERFYHKELDKYRNMKNIGMVEIGVQGNQSIDLWISYFPYAHIYGLDIDKKEYDNDRVDLFKCDQSKLDDLQSSANKFDPAYPIYFIIDDGSHIPEHQILSFNFLFNNVLQPGGIYIIEDIELSYWKRGSLYGNSVNYGWNNKNSLIEKFKLLIDYINKKYLSDDDKKQLNDSTNFLSDDTKNLISSIIFGQNCIIIYKKDTHELNENNKYNNMDYRYKDNN
jgi:hypothetical protein